MKPGVFRSKDLDVWQIADTLHPHISQVDLAGFSLHKWIGAPLGTGFLYIRKSRLPTWILICRIVIGFNIQLIAQVFTCISLQMSI